MRSYKTRGLDLEEVRRRKEEEGLQLRKSKREEQVIATVTSVTSVQDDLYTSFSLSSFLSQLSKRRLITRLS